jgi:hypothetical protein
VSDSYVSVPRSAYIQHNADWSSTITADQCFVPEDRRIDTGLLDRQGNRLFRVPETLPLGFAVKGR